MTILTEGLLPQELENLLAELVTISKYHDKKAKRTKFFEFFKREKHIGIRNEIVALTARIARHGHFYMHPNKE